MLIQSGEEKRYHSPFSSPQTPAEGHIKKAFCARHHRKEALIKILILAIPLGIKKVPRTCLGFPNFFCSRLKFFFALHFVPYRSSQIQWEGVGDEIDI